MASHLMEPGSFALLNAWELTNISSSSFHQTMWIERTTYTTGYTFPGILKWFEVRQISTVSHLKLELRKVFLSPNIIRAFVKSPLRFPRAQPASLAAPFSRRKIKSLLV